MPNQPSKISDWQEEFDKEFPKWSLGQPNSGSRDAEVKRIKSFISELISTQRTEVLEEVEENLRNLKRTIRPKTKVLSVFIKVFKKINQLKNKEK